MSFILVPAEGEDLVVNAWNWRPTLELLLASGVISEEDHLHLGGHGFGGSVAAEQAGRIAVAVKQKLETMHPGQRVLADLAISSEPKKLAVFSPESNADEIDSNELYSTSFDWLRTFAEFCQRSGGFTVM